MSDLATLEQRLVEAVGPDQEIDGLLWNFIDERTLVALDDRGQTDRIAYDIAPPYTSSIDAAVALVERVLPGAEYEITTRYGPAHVQLPLNGDECSDGRREDGNVPRAICLALVRALQAKSPTPQQDTITEKTP
jgi:hypothetical protein